MAGDFKFDEAVLAKNMDDFVDCGRDIDEMVRRYKAALAPDRISAERVNAVIHPENPMRDKLMRLATMGMPAGELMPPEFAPTGPSEANWPGFQSKYRGSSASSE